MVVLGPAVEEGVVGSGVAAALQKVERLVAGGSREYKATGASDLPRRWARVSRMRFWEQVWCGAVLVQQLFPAGCGVGGRLRFREDRDGLEAVSGADAWT